MLFILEGLQVGFWNLDLSRAPSDLEDKALYPTLTMQSSFRPGFPKEQPHSLPQLLPAFPSASLLCGPCVWT